jgi:flagellar assembly protein FliH
MSHTLFAEDFDIPNVAAHLAEPLPDPDPPLPSYSQDDLDAARTAARAEGFADGMAEAATQTAARLAATFATIAERMQDAADSAARVTEELADVFARLLFATLLAGFPRLRKLYGEEELRAIVRRAMPGMLLEANVVFHVNPAMVPMIEAELAAIRPKERQHMSIEPSDDIPPGDARIAWPHGAAVRDTVKIHNAVVEILEKFGIGPEPVAPDAQPR